MSGRPGLTASLLGAVCIAVALIILVVLVISAIH
jgi:hypothetical protein